MPLGEDEREPVIGKRRHPVEAGLGLPADTLAESRAVLARYGNMSSSTLMFVLAELMERPGVRKGVALAFGPGLAAEGFHFERAA